MPNLAGGSSLADEIAGIRREIFADHGEAMVVGTTEIPGKYFNRPREVVLPNGELQGLQISFDCQYEPAIGRLVSGDLVTIVGYGKFRFLSQVVPGGDESGLTHIELGMLK